MSVKLGLSFEGKNVDRGCFKAGCCRNYLELRDKVAGRWGELHNEKLPELIS
jgi:hypothetical protein